MKIMKKILAVALIVMSIMAIALPAMALTWSEHYGPGVLYSSTQGDVKKYIRNVQYDIRAFCDYQLDVDGYYGNDTKKAVSYFQHYVNEFFGYDLAVDGICGPATKQALHQLRPNCTGNHPND